MGEIRGGGDMFKGENPGPGIIAQERLPVRAHISSHQGHRVVSSRLFQIIVWTIPVLVEPVFASADSVLEQ